MERQCIMAHAIVHLYIWYEYYICAGYINYWTKSTVYPLMATIYYAKYQSTIAVAFD